MAIVVDQMTRRRRKYDWDSWLDGRVWRLEHGADFGMGVHSMRSAAHIAARRRGLRMETSVGPDDRWIEIQASGRE